MDGLLPLVIANISVVIGTFVAIVYTRGDRQKIKGTFAASHPAKTSIDVTKSIGKKKSKGNSKSKSNSKSKDTREDDNTPKPNPTPIEVDLTSIKQRLAESSGPTIGHSDMANATVYVFGDIEGQLQLLFNALIKLSLIEHDDATQEMRWIGKEHEFVVQCGDQVDKRAFNVHLDVETLVFTDYMQKISGGKFINIIGNHEFLNVHDPQNNDGTNVCTQTDKDVHSTTCRHTLFGYDEIFGRILRRRHFLFRINDAIFSHGGVVQEAIDSFKMASTGSTYNVPPPSTPTPAATATPPLSSTELDTMIANMNVLVNDDKMFMSKGFQEDWYPFLFEDDASYATGSGKRRDFGILWNRRYRPSDFGTNDTPIIPASMKGTIRLMVTGHNKGKAGMHVFTNTTGDKAMTTTCEFAEDPSGGCQGFKDIKDKCVFLMSDTVRAGRLNAMYIQYATLKCVDGKFVHLDVNAYSCGTDERCKVFGGLEAFKALIV